MDFFNKIIYGRSDFSPSDRKILDEHGNEIVTKIQLRKFPIDPNINQMFKFILSMHNRNLPYDNFFHLCIYCETDKGTKVLVDKGQNFQLDLNPRDKPETQTLDIKINSRKSLLEMLKNTHEEMGKNFFSYQTFHNNCQDFALRFLSTNGLQTTESTNFIKQDVSESVQGLDDFRKFVNTMTDVASRFDILKQGGALSQKNGLTNTQINELLSHISTFRGCYSKDQIPTNLERNCWYVLNMENANDGNGTHWVCFKYGYPVTYYDPFGAPPPIEVMKIVKRKMIWNSKQIQDMTSTACGWFCIACILSDAEMNYYDTETHFNRFIHSFSDDTVMNDKILKKMINYYFT